MQNLKSSGQTLIETLVSLVLIGVGVLALIRFQNYLAYENSVTQQKADAVFLSENQIENLRNFQVLPPTSGYFAYQSIGSSSLTASGITTNYTLTWNVINQTNPNYKTINLSTTWPDRAGATQTIQLNSIIAEIDPAYSAAIM